jgi:hypothetical protein
MATEESKQIFCWREIVREEKLCAGDFCRRFFFFFLLLLLFSFLSLSHERVHGRSQELLDRIS